ncbi:uncharacterized protein AKAW2_20229A [Aspergillus luchuensis]|uniref:Uncharacterized protein n=1 Tax=Aspergillus kawachii TaxID=1069201 RepID=A0A7R7W3D0_ASPKA|nr:uncharacterized protein AKAW2_20229A [Aspergillus luchuensis]BCR95289.1 hypothetical protein AKAW2_20229A [Aspergillus luchuensis]
MCWTIGLVSRLAFADPLKRNSDVGRALFPLIVTPHFDVVDVLRARENPGGIPEATCRYWSSLGFLIQPQPSFGSSRLISLRDVAATFVIVKPLEFAPVSLLLYR